MPKHDFLTPKAISHRIKAKGLQKLRWYCQMCQKQCRDDNGFKCHIMSESHQRQLLLVAESPGRFVSEFSREFLHGYVEILRRQYGTRRVHCNVVYQEYIKDKHHFHMNSTRWSTLTGFVQWLGREGLIKADPTPKGWFVTYIDRSPETLAKEAALAKKAKMDRDDAERCQKTVEDQIVRALAAKREKGDEEEEVVYSELQRSDESEKVVFSLSGQPSTSASAPAEAGKEEATREQAEALPPLPSTSNGFVRKKGSSSGIAVASNPLAEANKEAKKKKVDEGKESQPKDARSRKRKLSAFEEVLKMENQRKQSRRESWLAKGIVVKVMHEGLGDEYYRKKGVVENIKDEFTAIVQMLDSKDKLKIDQSHLETVIPAIGKPVLIVGGFHRGSQAVLERLDIDRYFVSVTITQGSARGKTVDRVPYEDVCKLLRDS